MKRNVPWRDASSYSRGERGNVEPTAWEVVVGSLRVLVHRYHGLDGWFGTCYEFRVEQYALESERIDEAQGEFVAYLTSLAVTRVEQLKRIKIGGAR